METGTVAVGAGTIAQVAHPASGEGVVETLVVRLLIVAPDRKQIESDVIGNGVGKAVQYVQSGVHAATSCGVADGAIVAVGVREAFGAHEIVSLNEMFAFVGEEQETVGAVNGGLLSEGG